MSQPTVFISYSHKDEDLKNQLRTHLQVLEQQVLIQIWDDRQIDAGGVWFDALQQAIDQAAVAVCLISADYLASDFCMKQEIPYLLQQRERGGMVVIPVLLRPALWKSVPWLSEIQMLPRDGKAVTRDFKGDEDTVFTAVAERIWDIVNRDDFPSPVAETSLWPQPEKVDITRLPVTGAALFGRQQELNLLDTAWDSDAIHVVSLVAYGGMGKSTLVNKWLEALEHDNYRGARRVYGWSFYSQGSGDRVTSADLFIVEALQWFGDADPTAGSPWDKGRRLAALIQQEKTLLLLDGLEPLQSSLEHERGRIKDPALAMLIEELARYNPGLCLITTRVDVADLEPFSATARQKDLERLSVEAGRALLRVEGVRGTDDELEEAIHAFGHHALALNLLATYLRAIPGQAIEHAANIPSVDVTEEAGKHARRVMAAFEQRFGEGPEVELLRMLGLFDRPADLQTLDALRRAPVIPDLTRHVQKLSDEGWLQLITKLRQAKLIAPMSQCQPDALDAHPLIREHFSERLRVRNKMAWRTGHRQLFEYLQTTSEAFPATMEQLTRLFQAVVHGCYAEQYEDALQVFRERIRREHHNLSVWRYAAYSADLAALGGFFDSRWTQPKLALKDSSRGYVLNEAGADLRALGQFEEAKTSIEMALKLQTQGEEWGKVANTAGNLIHCNLAIGELEEARRIAKQAVDIADRSQSRFQQWSKRALLGTVLHKLNCLPEALNAFREAETLMTEGRMLLFGLHGSQYSALLLDCGEYEDVRERVERTLVLSAAAGWIRDIGLEYVNLGRALDFLEDPQSEEALAKLHDGIEKLRESGHHQYIPEGLLARCEAYRRRALHGITSAREAAWSDLNEVLTLAARFGLRLAQCDAQLMATRLALDDRNLEEASQRLSRAQRLVFEMHYHLRDIDILVLTGRLYLLYDDSDTASYFLAKAKDHAQESGYRACDDDLEFLSEALSRRTGKESPRRPGLAELERQGKVRLGGPHRPDLYLPRPVRISGITAAQLINAERGEQ